MTHPARAMEFDKLYNGLLYEVQEGGVYEQIGEDGLRLYTYSDDTIYNRRWNDITLLARGLILDVEKREVVATPFPKFFNVGENDTFIPDLPFETFEKLDGSLIIIFHHDGKWKCATKGSFKSEQAKWAQEWIDNYDLSKLPVSWTFLAEVIYPENRIVVNYDKNKIGLHLLGAYNYSGEEITHLVLTTFANWLGWQCVNRYQYNNISDLLEKAKTLSVNEEGWVIRFSNGHRLKIKGDEYCRIHRMISNLTPLAIWRQLKAQEDLTITRKALPEEFWTDFDLIVELINAQFIALVKRIQDTCAPIISLSNKEVGLMLDEFPADIRKFVFTYKHGRLFEKKSDDALFEAIRPNRNILLGYRASSAINKIQENLKE